MLATSVLSAQEPVHYLHFNVGGGFNNLSYDLQNGTQQGQFGYTANAAYSYFFTPQWGFQSGLGVQSYKAKSTLNLLTNTPATDTDGDAYQLGTDYANWKEQQKALFLEIPLVGQYRHTIGNKFRMLASAGAKISIPLQTRYKTTDGQIVTTGYYPQWNVVLSDLPQHGFGTNTSTYEGNYTLKTAYMAVADLGGLIKLSDKKDLYVGGYFNYGLNNVLTPDSKPVSEQNGTYNGVLASDLVSKVRPIAFGIKIGLYLHKKTVSPMIPAASTQPAATVPQEAKAKDVPAAAVPPAQATQNTKPAIAEQAVTPAEDPEAKLQAAQKIAGRYKFSFGLNSTLPKTSQKEDTRALKDYLAANPDLTLYLYGHTCDLGSYLVNVRIGERRASAVKQLLIKDGVPAERMKTVSKAYNEPLFPNTSAENRAKNRRVELKFVKEAK